jgi:hypothetical protein
MRFANKCHAMKCAFKCDLQIKCRGRLIEKIVMPFHAMNAWRKPAGSPFGWPFRFIEKIVMPFHAMKCAFKCDLQTNAMR